MLFACCWIQNGFLTENETVDLQQIELCQIKLFLKGSFQLLMNSLGGIPKQTMSCTVYIQWGWECEVAMDSTTEPKR